MAPMAHLNGFLSAHGIPTRYPYVRVEEAEQIERIIYHWLHSLRIDLEQRDQAGDRVVADFIMRMQNGSYGAIPRALDEEEASVLSRALFAGIQESVVEDSEGEALEKRLLGGKWWA